MVGDRRLTPANGRVAAESLRGQVAAERFVAGEAASIAAPLTDLRRSPGGPRDRQLLRGEGVQVYDRAEGWSFVQAARDGYCGWLAEGDLGPEIVATHRVIARATHLYPAADLKREEMAALSFGARLRVVGGAGAFYEVAGGGFVPRAHLRPINAPLADPATVAQIFFGTPYLWGGNSAFGIDCSGLVQAACHACNIPCPGDSDLQAAGLGVALPSDAALRRGDLLFWDGHVAMMVDETVLIHATAAAMAVAYEDRATAEARIAEQEGMAVTVRRRLG